MVLFDNVIFINCFGDISFLLGAISLCFLGCSPFSFAFSPLSFAFFFFELFPFLIWAFTLSRLSVFASLQNCVINIKIECLSVVVCITHFCIA